MRYRLTKYSDSLKDEWDEIIDVDNKKYNLTLDKYLYIENLYIQSAMELAEIKDNDCLIISDFEKCPEFFEIMDISDPSLKEIFFSDYKSDTYKSLYSGVNSFKGTDFSNLLRILLRHEAWFVISVNDFKIDVGYEYYLHIYTDRNLFDKKWTMPNEVRLELF